MKRLAIVCMTSLALGVPSVAVMPTAAASGVTGEPAGVSKVQPRDAISRCVSLARQYRTNCRGTPVRVNGVCTQRMEFGYTLGRKSRTVFCDMKSYEFFGKWRVAPPWM